VARPSYDDADAKEALSDASAKLKRRLRVLGTGTTLVRCTGAAAPLRELDVIIMPERSDAGPQQVGMLRRADERPACDSLAVAALKA
jgi:hypothetical protein